MSCSACPVDPPDGLAQIARTSHYFRGLTAARQPSATPFDETNEPTSCCGAGDVVKTKFKVEPRDSSHPQDTWFAWLKGKWVRIPGKDCSRLCAGRPGLSVHADDRQCLRDRLLCSAERRAMMRAELALAVTTLIASPAFAGSEEWPDGPKKEFFRGLQRPRCIASGLRIRALVLRSRRCRQNQIQSTSGRSRSPGRRLVRVAQRKMGADPTAKDRVRLCA